jgi:RNA polymerase-binding protein DksA
VSRKSPAAAKKPAGKARSVVVAGKTKPTTKTKTPSRPVVAVKTPSKAPSKANGTPASKVAKGAAPMPIKSSNAVKPKHQIMRRPEPPAPRALPIPEAVPTNGKPRKNQAGLSSKELEHYRDLLLEKRRELVGDMYSMESEALRTSGGTNLSNLPIHMADMGTDNYEQEFTLGLVEKDRGLLREINTALAKIQNGTYGICEGTGKPISKPRLEAQPWARHSIEYARQLQRPGMGMRVG